MKFFATSGPTIWLLAISLPSLLCPNDFMPSPPMMRFVLCSNLLHLLTVISPRSSLGVEGVVWEMVSTNTDKDNWRRTLLQGYLSRSMQVPKPILFCCDHRWWQDWQNSVYLFLPATMLIEWSSPTTYGSRSNDFRFRFCLEAAFKMHTPPQYFPTVFDTYVLFSFRPSSSSLHKIDLRLWRLKATRNMDYFCKHLRFFNAPLSLAPF